MIKQNNRRLQLTGFPLCHMSQCLWNLTSKTTRSTHQRTPVLNVPNRHNSLSLSLSHKHEVCFRNSFSTICNQSWKWRRNHCWEYTRESPLSASRKTCSRKWQTISFPILTSLLLSSLSNPTLFLLQVITLAFFSSLIKIWILLHVSAGGFSIFALIFVLRSGI